MGSLNVFSARDVRQRSGELLSDAEDGRLAIITKHGRPAILAVPFDERLVEMGVHRAMALHLFEQRLVTLFRPQEWRRRLRRSSSFCWVQPGFRRSTIRPRNWRPRSASRRDTHRRRYRASHRPGSRRRLDLLRRLYRQVFIPPASTESSQSGLAARARPRSRAL